MAPDATSPRTDPERVRRVVRRRSEALARRELDRALARLEATGGLTDAQREIVAELAAAVVDGVLAAPETALQRASDRDAETVRTTIELFEPD